MKICPNCGMQLNDEDRFCTNCGSVMAQEQPATETVQNSITCPNCGMPLTFEDRFCTNCGTMIVQESMAQEQPVPESAEQNFINCPNCGMPMGPEDHFCTNCGTVPVTQEPMMQEPMMQEPTIQEPMMQEPMMQEPMMQEPVEELPPQGIVQCANCGLVMPEGTMFCERCGNPLNVTMAPYPQALPQQQQKPKKKSSLAVILVSVILGTIILLLGGVIAYLILSGSLGTTKDEADVHYHESAPIGIDDHYYAEESVEDTVEVVWDETEEETEDTAEDTTEAQTEEETAEPEEELEGVDYFIENCGERYFSMSEIGDFTKEDCRLARNGVYARHGRMFNDAGLQHYYLKFDWYYPTVKPDNFSESVLNRYEIANRDLIIAYEKARGYN